jgi:hypothetical protein
VQEEKKQYEKNKKRQADVLEKDVDLDEDKSNEIERNGAGGDGGRRIITSWIWITLGFQPISPDMV